MTNNNKQYLRDLYFNPESPVSFSGINNIFKKVRDDGYKISKPEIKKFLEEQPTYTLHKRLIKKFPFIKTMVSYIDQQWQDLVDMHKFSNSNKGYRFILAVIDIFSRFTWAKPSKSKRGDEITDVFTEIFKKNKPVKIQFDDGK
jgi:hypothetical protein